MAIAHDASTDLGSGTGDLSAVHTPIGVPKGALVLAVQNTNAADQDAGCVYGGVAMRECLGSPFLHPTGSEDGAIYAYFLEDPPPGPQTVTLDTTSTGSSRRAVCFTVTSADKVAIEDIAWLDQASGANPALVMNTGVGVGTLTYAALHSGQDAVTSIAAGSGMTEVLEHDFGSQTASWIRSTSVDPGSGFTAGWTVATEEAGAVAISLREVVPSGLSIRDELMADSPNVLAMFGEPSGTAAVDEVGGASGVYSGAGPGWTLGAPADIPNDPGTAVDLNGTTGKVQFADRNEFDVGDTYAIFIRVRLDALGSRQTFFDAGANGPIVRADTDNRVLHRRNGVGDVAKSTITLPQSRFLCFWICKNANTEHVIEVDTVDVLGTVTNQTMSSTAIAKGIGAADAGIQDFLNGAAHAFAIFPSIPTRARRQAIVHAALFGPSVDQDGDLEQAEETDSAGDLTPDPGAADVPLDAAEETDAAGDLEPAVEGPTGTLEAGEEIDAAGTLTPDPGVAEVELGMGSEIDSGGDLVADPGAVSVSLDLGDETDSAGDLTPAAGEVGGTLDGGDEIDTAGELAPVAIEPIIPAIHVREKPPLWLAHRIELPNGRPVRWGPDEPDPAMVPSGVTHSSSMPGGYEDSSANLPRRPGIDYGDQQGFATWQMYTADGEIASETRLRITGDGDFSVTPNGVGWQAHLEDDKTAVLIPVDCDASAWGDPPMWRKAETASAGQDQSKIQVGQVDGGLVFDLPNEELQNGWRGQAWRQMPSGVKVAAVGYDGVRNGAFTTINTAALRATDSTSAPTVADAYPLTLDDTPRVVVLTTPRGKVYLQVFASGTVTPAAGHQERYNAVRVYGHHPGINRHDVAGDLPGVIASEVVAYALQRWAPLLNFTVGPNGTIVPTSFPIPHLPFPDPTTVAEIARQSIRFELPDWAVWDKRTFYMHPRGARGRRWRFYVGPTKLKQTGQDMQRVWKAIMVAYRDPDGTTRRVGPPGSGADIETAALVDPDPLNPANAAGIPRIDTLDMGKVSQPGAAIQVGQQFLELAKLIDRSGSAVVTGYALDDRGILHPCSHIKAGDYASWVDAADTSYRRIVRASHTQDTRSVALDIDAPPQSLDAILQQLDVVLVPLGA